MASTDATAQGNDDNARPELPAGVGLTALNVARGRAAESRRADRLFNDPYAREFMTAAAPGLAATIEQTVSQAATGRSINVGSVLDEYVPIRTRFFDDYLLEACEAGCRQVAIVAAGLDTRAFRLAWPQGAHLFELDLPDLFAFKERVLAIGNAAPACRRAVVPIDLRNDWPAALLNAGFQPDRPTAWLLEGILMYLHENERNALLERVGRLSASGSRLGLEPPGWTIPASLLPALARGVMDQSAVTQVRTLAEAAQRDASVADPVSWLAEHGWKARLYDAREQFAVYGRSVPPAVEALLGATHRWLATGERAR